MKQFYPAILFLLIAFPSEAQNNALSFDGVDDYCLAPSNAIPSGNSARTVEAWVKLASAGTHQRVIASWGGSSLGGRFTFNLNNTDHPRIEVGGSGINAPAVLPVGSWHHLAVTFDPLGEPEVKLFVDGIVVASGDLTVTVNTDPLGGLSIGRRQDSVNYFNGAIDELRIWNIARSEADIANFRSLTFCVPPAELLADYDFNQGIAGGMNGSVTTLPDATGNGNDAPLSGFALDGPSSNWVTGAPLTGDGDTTTTTVSTCGPYTVPGGSTYSETGLYVATMTTLAGCTAYTALDLTITPLDTVVTTLGHLLVAEATGVSYQWLDCNNGYAPVPNSSGNAFNPPGNGSYAVRITAQGCSDTSSCHLVNYTGIEEAQGAERLSVHPNPATDHVVVDGNAGWAGAEYRMADLMGRTAQVGMLTGEGGAVIDLEQVRPGSYFIEIQTKDRVQRVVVQKQ